MAFIESIRKMLVLTGRLEDDEFIMFHGTSRAAWNAISSDGFRKSCHEYSAMGKGVYLTKSAFKAMEFARKEDGRMIVVRVRLGRMYRVQGPDDPNIKNWQAAGYDSAWAEGGHDVFRRHEVCVTDPDRIVIIEAKKPFLSSYHATDYPEDYDREHHEIFFQDQDRTSSQCSSHSSTSSSSGSKAMMLYTYERLANALNSNIPDSVDFAKQQSPKTPFDHRRKKKLPHDSEYSSLDQQIAQYIASLPPLHNLFTATHPQLQAALATRPLVRYFLQQQEEERQRRKQDEEEEEKEKFESHQEDDLSMNPYEAFFFSYFSTSNRILYYFSHSTAAIILCLLSILILFLSSPFLLRSCCPTLLTYLERCQCATSTRCNNDHSFCSLKRFVIHSSQ